MTIKVHHVGYWNVVKSTHRKSAYRISLWSLCHRHVHITVIKLIKYHVALLPLTTFGELASATLGHETGPRLLEISYESPLRSSGLFFENSPGIRKDVTWLGEILYGEVCLELRQDLLQVDDRIRSSSLAKKLESTGFPLAYRFSRRARNISNSLPVKVVEKKGDVYFVPRLDEHLESLWMTALFWIIHPQIQRDGVYTRWLGLPTKMKIDVSG